ncbi:ABC transporter ATP-binding protein [Aurantimicrobium photophilum]|uniref:Teichoic acids export ATP-binding protein TagH n=1 Tax=Aurantimicrobium photophilum TaxID=1987356 RepID=A0A2Z3RY71_9MICO|nr:ABC transporter ATP-binding protein [Aurantimicrobium photophilum]AWR21064.1 Teichoic acids export ATP-binding protein TagH [Aurantimicrobium photophilum]
MNEVAVRVDHLGKKFRIYSERNQSLKSALMRGRVSKYDQFWALRDFSLEVEKGTTLGLVGGNGSGKSTLLKTLAKIYWPDEGDIEYFGRMSALLEVGSGFHPELTGRENIFLNGSILGMKRKEIEKRYEQIVEFSGVREFIDQPVKNYSSGMYVRLGFSVAIHVEPDILVVDEVLAVGDAAFQEQCFERFRELKRQGTTIILVSHDMDAVNGLCDQVAWVNKGKLQQLGPARSVTHAYLKNSGEKK